MDKRSIGPAPEKTDQSNTDYPPQEQEGLSGSHKLLERCAMEVLARLADPHQDPDEDIKEKERLLYVIMAGLSKRVLDKYECNFGNKWNSSPVRHCQDSQINTLLEEMFNLEIEAKVFLGSKNYSQYLMDKNVGEIKGKYRILTKYVSGISQGRSASCCNVRQLLNDHQRLNSLIGRVCQGYRIPVATYLPLNERNMLQLQKSFNYKPGDGVNADPPELSCSPEPEGRAMEVPSCHNSYEDNLEKECNSPNLCHSNDLRIKRLSEHTLNLETEMGHVKDMIDSEIKLDKCCTQAIQEKFKILTKHVHEIPSSSGCNNPQLELLQKNHESLNSLIAEVIKPYSYGEDHGMANGDDHNQASPASSTTDTDQFTHQLGDKEMQDKKTEEHHEPQMHAISIYQENEAVLENQEMGNRLSAITELLSRLKQYSVDQNIGEEIPYFSLLVAALAALGKPFDLRSQETSTPRSLSEAFFILGVPIIWSAIFFSIFIFTAIHVGSRRRVFAVSFLVLFLTYYFIALANTTTGSSVLFGSVTMSSFWFVFGGAALVFVLVILLVMVLSAFLV